MSYKSHAMREFQGNGGSFGSRSGDDDYGEGYGQGCCGQAGIDRVLMDIEGGEE